MKHPTEIESFRSTWDHEAERTHQLLEALPADQYEQLVADMVAERTRMAQVASPRFSEFLRAEGDDEREAHSTARDRRRRRPEPTTASTELKPGQTRKETEGVFTVRDGSVEFVPIKLGIAGDKYFEVLSGIKEPEQVITGPYNSVRGMADGDPVKVDNKVNAKK